MAIGALSCGVASGRSRGAGAWRGPRRASGRPPRR
jgi:hypothetical protein